MRRVPTNYFAPEYRYTTDRDEERERLGASIAIAFKPTDSTELVGEWFHSDLEVLTSEASLKFPFANETPGLITNDPAFRIRSTRTACCCAARSRRIRPRRSRSSRTPTSPPTTSRSRSNSTMAAPVRFSVGGAYSKADQEGDRCEQRRAVHTVRRAQVGGGAGFNPNATAPANYQFTYDNRNGELPSFALANNQDLFTRPENGFFKSHWVFGDETNVENWSTRADVEWDPEFIKSSGVTFTGGLRMAERTVDYTFGRYLADYHSFSPLDGTRYGADWTNYGYFQDGAIGPKACDALSGGGAPLGTAGRPNCAVDSRFGTAPAFITPYQTFPVARAGRADQRLLGFGHRRRQSAWWCRIGSRWRKALPGSSRCIRIINSHSLPIRCKVSRWRKKRRRHT